MGRDYSIQVDRPVVLELKLGSDWFAPDYMYNLYINLGPTHVWSYTDTKLFSRHVADVIRHKKCMKCPQKI